MEHLPMVISDIKFSAIGVGITNLIGAVAVSLSGVLGNVLSVISILCGLVTLGYTIDKWARMRRNGKQK